MESGPTIAVVEEEIMTARRTVTVATQVIGLKLKRRITGETTAMNVKLLEARIVINGPITTVRTTRKRKKIITEAAGKTVQSLRINRTPGVMVETRETNHLKIVAGTNRRRTTRVAKVTGAEGKETPVALKLSHGKTAQMPTVVGAVMTNSSSGATRNSNSLIITAILLKTLSRSQRRSRLVRNSRLKRKAVLVARAVSNLRRGKAKMLAITGREALEGNAAVQETTTTPTRVSKFDLL